MSVILALFIDHLQPIMIGLASILGVFFVSRTETFKAENQVLNDGIEDANKIIEAQNEAMRAVNNATPTDINGITDLMQHNKL